MVPAAPSPAYQQGRSPVDQLNTSLEEEGPTLAVPQVDVSPHAAFTQSQLDAFQLHSQAAINGDIAQASTPNPSTSTVHTKPPKEPQLISVSQLGESIHPAFGHVVRDKSDASKWHAICCRRCQANSETNGRFYAGPTAFLTHNHFATEREEPGHTIDALHDMMVEVEMTFDERYTGSHHNIVRMRRGQAPDFVFLTKRLWPRPSGLRGVQTVREGYNRR